jgi:hypothetical protein
VTDIVLPSAGQISQATAVEQARAVAEVAAAVQVAQMNPRDMRRAWEDMREACSRLALAERAFYKVPNRGTGPSVHLARELLRIWGNADAGVHELRRDDVKGESEIRAYAWDQQTNVRQSRTIQVPHQRMAGKERKPLNDLTDVYLNNQNIGARMVRECIFNILPADFTAEAQELCRRTVENGDGKPLDQRITEMTAAFKTALRVTVAQIETRIGRKRGQWTAADVADLRIVFSSIQRRETTVDDEFPPPVVTAAEITGTSKTSAPAPASDWVQDAAAGQDWPEAAQPADAK